MLRTLIRGLRAVLLFTPLLAHAAAPSPLRIEQAYSYATPAPGITAVGFLTLINDGPADRLVAVQTAAARRVEIHEMSMAGGIMRMRALPDGLPVPAQGRVALEPGGYHLMLIDPAQALKVGGEFPLTLEFASGRRLDVRLDVRSREAEESHAGH